jgi:hypothetical protein
MGRKAKRTAPPSSELPPSLPVLPSKPSASYPSAQTCLSEVRSLYYSLIAHFKTKRKLRHRSEVFHITLLKSDVKHKLRNAVAGLSGEMPANELQNVMRDFGDGLAEILAAEIQEITVREEFQAWMSETSTLMTSIGAEFHAAAGEFLPAKADLSQEFRLSILEKANRSFADRLAPKGHHAVDRMASRKRGSWLVAPQPSEDPKLGSMSLDQIMDFISTAEEEKSEQSDEFGSEVAQFRKKLETAWSLERKVVPLLSEQWLDRVSQRLSAS